LVEAAFVVARRFPRQVKAILIRDVTGQGPAAERYDKAFHGLPKTLWQVFREPSEGLTALN
jgi:phosphatidate phosphatase APP1